MKLLAALLLGTLSCLAVAPDVAVYPGAVLDETVSKSVRRANADNAAYNTADPFEKVDEFYQKAGGEDLPHSRNVGAEMKFVVLRFSGKKFQVQLSWVQADKRHGTVIQLVQKP